MSNTNLPRCAPRCKPEDDPLNLFNTGPLPMQIGFTTPRLQRQRIFETAIRAAQRALRASRRR